MHSDLHVEGLFRVPGNSVRQQTLKELLNSGADVNLESGDFHPNDVATLLKTFLGELPEPLLTHRHFHAHLKIAGMRTLIHFLFYFNVLILGYSYMLSLFARHFSISHAAFLRSTL